MPKRNAVPAKPTHFSTEPYVEIDGFAIHAGDIIKIKGEYGSSFKFIGVTTNKNTGASWIDCFEISRGVCSAFRSFKQERVKRVPTRRKRAKRVV
jgi:hypothetical protein